MGLVVTMSGKKKSKGVPMPLDTFLSNADDSWADVEDDYTPTEDAPRESYDNRGPPSPRDDGPRGRGDRYANRYADSAPPRLSTLNSFASVQCRPGNPISSPGAPSVVGSEFRGLR